MEQRRRQVVVVGASAAGLRCAARLARLDPSCRVTVLERCGTFSYAACGFPYVLSGEIGDTDALRRTADGTLRDERFFAAVKGVQVRTGACVAGVDPDRRRVAVERDDGSVESVPYDDLVLAMGARPRKLPGQPVDARVRSVHTTQDVEPLARALAGGEVRRVVIVGAGMLGCELADAFRGLWGLDVTVIEAAGAPLSSVLDREMRSIVVHELTRNRVRLVAGLPVTGIDADPGGVVVSAGPMQVRGDLVVVAIGVEPNVELARRAGVAIGTTGAIAIDDHFATSVPGIWAVGDCVELREGVAGMPVYRALGSLANREGRTLANVLAGRDDHLPPVVGAVAVKVFDCNIAAVGLTREVALAAGLAAHSVWISTPDRAHYLPETREIAINLVYSPSDRRVLGVQAVGDGETAKRVDVATQLLARGASLAEFAAIEHAYAPPYAPAVEPLAVAAWAAQDCEDGVPMCSPTASLDHRKVLDVRNREEAAIRPVGVGDVVNIPLAELRDAWVGEGSASWVVVCERGGRSAEAVRWLRGHGTVAEYLGGGLYLRGFAGGGEAT
jgi:NADPH-dependent 2,4-dienoyl-CoA reductase/sulfur reductase-like enzyme/rhodanese-related sulfurtransferase